MKKKAEKQELVNAPYPTALIQNCHFSGPTVSLEAKDAITALAKAAEENAKAIASITKLISVTSMVSINN